MLTGISGESLKMSANTVKLQIHEYMILEFFALFEYPICMFRFFSEFIYKSTLLSCLGIKPPVAPK